MRRIAITILLCSLSQAEIAPRFREDGVTWTYGSHWVPVHAAQPWIGWDYEHEPTGVFQLSSTSLTERWDFAGCAASNASGKLQFSCTGIQLPAGTEIKFGSAGVLPSGLVPWKSNRRKSYYIVNPSYASSVTTAGTFQVAETNGGPALAFVDAGSPSNGHNVTFAGWRVVTTLDAPLVYPVKCDPATDRCHMNDSSGNLVPHSFTTGGTTGVAFFVSPTGSTLPQPLRTHWGGQYSKYCIAAPDTSYFYLRRQYNTSGTCPTSYVPPNNTLSVTCERGTKNCTILGGSPYFQNYMALKFVSVTSGTMGPEIELGTKYKTNLPSTSTTFQIRLVKLDEDPDESNIVFSETFTAVIEVAYEDITTSGTGQYYVQRRTSPSSHAVRKVEGYPQGTLFTFRASTDLITSTSTSSGYGNFEVTGGRITMIAKVPAISAPGTYNVIVKVDESTTSTEASGAWQDLSFKLTVATLTPLVRSDPTPSSFTTPPELSKWRTIMTASTSGGGAASSFYPRCPAPRSTVAEAGATIAAKNGAPGSMSEYSRNWFYDGVYGFLKVAAYKPANVPNQEQFANCSHWLADEIADEYRNTQEAINWMPRGLYVDYGASRGTTRRAEANKLRDVLLAIVAAPNGASGNNNDFSMREHSFALSRRLHRFLLTGVHDPHIPIYIDVLIGWLYAKATNASQVAWDEPFMLGIKERELTLYYKYYYRDPRIPVVLKMMADKFMADWYDRATHRMIYNPYPKGERCDTSCQGYITSTINGMVGATMAWVWRYTGDNTYRDHYDELVGNIFATEYPYSAKAWNQAYSYRGFDGDVWRRGVEVPW